MFSWYQTNLRKQKALIIQYHVFTNGLWKMCWAEAWMPSQVLSLGLIALSRLCGPEVWSLWLWRGLARFGW